MSHTLPELNYDYDALEGDIDAKTMEIHHTKHHQGYVDKLNAAIEDHSDLKDKTIEELLSNIKSLPADIQSAVRNNGGGHFNHSLFWTIMSPDGGGEPEGELAAAIEEQFESFDNFKEKFTEAATKQFGSGWAWLIKTNNGLEIISTPNQDNPLMEGVVEKTGTPILGIDVWEHAYYLKYQNKRADYVSSWWNVLDWSEVSKRFEK